MNYDLILEEIDRELCKINEALFKADIELIEAGQSINKCFKCVGKLKEIHRKESE